MKHSRRDVIKLLLRGGQLAALGSLLPYSNRIVNASGDGAPHRFLQIFLLGGWDSAVGTDPVIGAKASSGNYETVYASKQIAAVSGKNKLILGEGMLPAAPGFSVVNTAIVNGIYVEVTAHELAMIYMLTGQQTLTRTQQPTAFLALAANAYQAFPPHVVLGGVLPLGNTSVTAPPLQLHNVSGLETVLKPPEQGMAMVPKFGDIGHKLILDLNKTRHGSTPSNSVAEWNNAESRIFDLYRKNYAESLLFTDEVKARYNTSEVVSNMGQIAGAYLVLKSGMTPFVTCFVHGFDTHSESLDVQISRQKEVAGAINTLINDMRNTPDPAAPHLSLMDTTTVLVTSEFVRTPKFALAGGTDHWQSASAILFGKNVVDNTVIGATDTDAKALGWEGGRAVSFSEATVLSPVHLAATILRGIGYADLSQQISDKVIDGLFV